MQPHPVLLEPKRLEVKQIGLVTGENVAGQPGAARHFQFAQRLIERDRAERAAVKRVVRRLEPPALLQHDVMVVVVKQIARHRDVGRHAAVPSGGDRGREAGGRVALVKAAKRVALEVRVHPVEVESVVAAAAKLVVVQLEDRPGPAAAADVEDVAVTGRRAEPVPRKHQFAAGADADAAHVFAVA